MALVKCPECKHDVSTKAEACPGCGHPAPDGGWPLTLNTCNDYSWEELSAISSEIAGSFGSDAIDVAIKHGLCNPDGRLDGTQVKDVVLRSGTFAQAQIVGFNHDDKADGSGRAGISFVFKDCVAMRAMNSERSNSGGWRASKMRSWLNTSFLDELPPDLRSAIVPVEKKTNNEGRLWDWHRRPITETSDTVWLPSFHEIVGATALLLDIPEEHKKLINREGGKYQLSSDLSVTEVFENPVLIKAYNGETCSWLLRSTSSIEADGFYIIGAHGKPSALAYADSVFGVAPGFCI